MFVSNHAKTQSVLVIKKLNKSFGTNPTLRDINLHVQGGEFVSVLGPSGCGKTTLLRTIAGLEKPDSGQIYLDGNEITHALPHKRSIHTVFQRYALFPHLNVFDNVAFGLRCQKVPEDKVTARVKESLALVGLENHGARSIVTLSGGEQQRVALIRALVSAPNLLLLDEPLGALDAKIRLQIQSDLVAIQKRVKTTFVFVTHDQQEALAMSDRVVVMEKGCIAQFATPNEIYENPASLYVANFVGTLNQLSGSISNHVVQVPNLGAVQAHNTSSLSGSVRIGIRPEKLSVTETKSESSNSFESRVVSRSYLGTHTQYEMRLQNGVVFQVFQQHSTQKLRREFQIGDCAYINWTPETVHVFLEPQQ